MEVLPEFQDRELVCCDCGKPFFFSANEQRFYFKKSLTITKRCPQCRLMKKLDHAPIVKKGGNGND